MMCVQQLGQLNKTRCVIFSNDFLKFMMIIV